MQWGCNKQLSEVKEKNRKRRLSDNENKEESEEDEKGEPRKMNGGMFVVLNFRLSLL